MKHFTTKTFIRSLALLMLFSLTSNQSTTHAMVPPRINNACRALGNGAKTTAKGVAKALSATYRAGKFVGKKVIIPAAAMALFGVLLNKAFLKGDVCMFMALLDSLTDQYYGSNFDLFATCDEALNLYLEKLAELGLMTKVLYYLKIHG